MRQSNTIDGVTVTNTHSGQKRRYGDSYYEYEVTSDLPAEEVEKICREQVRKAIPYSEWKAENMESMSKHFRAHYRFTDRGNGTFFYQVIFPYTD